MPAPNKKKSPYVFFVIDWKRRAESNGRKFENGLIQAFTDPECSAAWKSLSMHQKQYYMSRAGRVNTTAAETVNENEENGKRATNGQLLSTLIRKEKEKMDYEETMKEYINSLVTSAVQHNNLRQVQFLVIHCNWFFASVVQENESDYFPAEFAVAEYCIENGIGNLYHEIINAKIPLGYGFEAQQTSQNYHKIPAECKEGEQDFKMMYQRMEDFLSPFMKADKFPPLFTSKYNTGAVRSLLNRFCDSIDKSRDTFLVYNFEELFAVIYNTLILCDDGHPIHRTVTDSIIEKDIYCYSKDLACKFHQLLDDTTQYCSESIIKRWGFTISTYAGEFLDLELIPGIHYPKSRDHGDINSLGNSMQNLSLYTSATNMPSSDAPIQNWTRSSVTPKYTLPPTIPPQIPRPLRLPNTMCESLLLMFQKVKVRMDFSIQFIVGTDL